MKRVLSILAVVAMIAVFVTPSYAATEKEWTFAVFLNGHNNLDPFAVSNLEQMARVGSSDILNIVSMTDRESNTCSYQYVEKGNIKTIQELGSVDMGDYKKFVEFAQWCKDNYPAKHYMFIVWNHGSGWKNATSAITKGISYDDLTGNHITTEQLGIACTEIKKILGHNIDILAMDACLMQMAEVAWVMKDNCDYIMASEETEPGDGYPYDNMLATLKPGMGAEEFGKAMVKEFGKAYTGGCFGTKDVTTSLIKTAELGNVKDAIDGFAKAAQAGNYAAQFKTALQQVQKFYYRTNIDMIHLATLLNKSINDQAMKTATQKLIDAAKKSVVENVGTGYTMKNALGIAVYFPTSSASFDKAYGKLAFAADTMWDEMCFDYYKKSAVKTIVADLQSGDTNSLAEFVRTNNSPEIAQHVVTAINFAVYSEGGFDKAVEMSVKNLINELKNK